MTLTEFSRDWVPILQLVVAVIGLLSLILVWSQIRQTTRWNRLNSQHNFLNNSFSRELDEDLYEASSRLGIDLKGRREPLNNGEMDRLLSDNAAYTTIIAYLNEYENICAAVRAGIADPEMAYGVHSSRALKDFKVFWPVIDRIRKRDEDGTVLLEFENVCSEWIKKAESIRRESLARATDLRRRGGIQNRS